MLVYPNYKYGNKEELYLDNNSWIETVKEGEFFYNTAPVKFNRKIDLIAATNAPEFISTGLTHEFDVIYPEDIFLSYVGISIPADFIVDSKELSYKIYNKSMRAEPTSVRTTTDGFYELIWKLQEDLPIAFGDHQLKADLIVTGIYNMETSTLELRCSNRTINPVEPVCCLISVDRRLPADKSSATEESIKTKLTIEDIESVIDNVEYLREDGSTYTLCRITLKNGCVVTGENSCISKENWSATLGRKHSYEKAIERVWELEGYLLRQKLYEAGMLTDNPTENTW